MQHTIAGFDWDDGNWPKCQKHGVSKEEIEEVFTMPPKVMPDPCPDEPRMRTIGQASNMRYIFLVLFFVLLMGKNSSGP